MKRLRIIPWVLGIGVVVASVAGAKLLPHNEGSATPAPKAAPVTTEGLVAKGTCQSDPPVVAYSLPAHLPAGTIVEVFVTNGSQVKVGDKLLRYDDTLLAKDLTKAELAYNLAVQKYHETVAAVDTHKVQIEQSKELVNEANEARTNAKEAYSVAQQTMRDNLTVLHKNDPAKTAGIENEIRKDPNILMLKAKVDSAESAHRKAELGQRTAETGHASYQAISKGAAYHAELLNKDIEKAKKAIEDCTITAKAAGTIEQLSAAVGQTVYPQSKPLLFLVPSGKRIIVAEIVPDFAYKIGGRVGQKVTITDDSHTTLAYEGVVKRISDAFLPKPTAAADLVTGKTNAVLNVEIEVLDANPVGKPPLRVGQPVRVSFP